MNYPRNVWYVAAFSADIKAGRALGRKLLDESVTLYRGEGGVLAAVHSTCPHRFAPLHQGQVRGNHIECPYHGLRFGPDGMCVHNPHGNGEIPKAARVRSYPVAERDGLAWIWMGDAALCDPTLVPDYSVIRELPEQSLIWTHIHSNARCDLMTDNIMDLSHADLLHPGSLATGGEVTKLVPKIEDRGDEVKVSWRWRSASTPPVFSPVVPPGMECNISLEVTWRPAALMYIRFAVESPEDGAPIEVRGCHLMTPETERSSHYFFFGSRNFLVDDAALTAFSQQQMLHVFSQEDKPMIEAAQAAMGDSDLWEMKPVLLSGDAGAVRVRRKLQAMVEAERA